MKKLFIITSMMLMFGLSNSQSNMWRGANNQGLISTFHKLDIEKWTETNNDDVFYYKEVKKDVNEILLKDVYRDGVFIKLSGKQCFYKDNNNDWMLIYTGNWKFN